MIAWQATVQDQAGNAVLLPVVTVYKADGETLAAIYGANGAALPNPMTGTVEGFVQFWAAPGVYRVVGASAGTLTPEWTVKLGPLSTPEDFGAVGDGVTDDTAAVQAWAASGGALSARGRYLVRSRVNFTVMLTKIDALRATFIWGGPATEGFAITLSGAGSDIHGAELDGSDLVSRGIEIAGNGCDVTGCNIHNFWSNTNTALGIGGYALGGGRVSGNRISKIHSVGNGSAGDANGASRAVQIQNTQELTTGYEISENYISDITGEEGDGIHILLLGSNIFRDSAGTSISRNKIKGCSKRCIKVQAHGVMVDYNACRLDVAGAYSSIDIINSSLTSVTNNDVRSTIAAGRGIQYTSFDIATFGRCYGGIIARNRVVTAAGETNLGIYVLGADFVSVEGNGVDIGRVVIDNSIGSVASGNLGTNMFIAGADGFVSIRSNCADITASDNTLASGDGYTCVRIDAPGTVANNNRTRATTNAASSAVYVQASGNMITGNSSKHPNAPVVRYNNTTESAQVLVANNVRIT